ncbi:hypothetical protein APR04_004559 [Promicromonospora umidemergens]|uniref:Alkaline shock family protein YloU n=1 Tax=Promicromonospora umidemergens TaxID=629679 RepID=A0ABP8XHZ3_9MICO|nr:hypothetical protein [Promicromonospora umidemergens]MCP2285624.1 hypothetical protein [Promicromonospora umidemergens]
MTAEHLPHVAAEIEATVRAIDGVSDVYATGSAVLRTIGASARRLGLRADEASPVLVHRDEDGVHVDIALGVHATDSATRLTRIVDQAVRDLLAEQGLTNAYIAVSVVHVDELPPALAPGRS